jgi:RNA polymerase sigma-70 factor (ECF subfamily)
MAAHVDLEFARALAGGEPEALLAFEHRYRSVVRHALGTALRRWRPEAAYDPEDLVQDFVGFLFLDGGRRLRSYQGKASFGAWLYTVALRYFQRRMARQVRDKRSPDVVLARLPDRDGRDPEFATIAAREAERVRAAVKSLPPQDRLFVRLFFVENLNAAEVARTLGKGPSAVRMRKMRLLERLRALLGESSDLVAMPDDREPEDSAEER